MSLIEVEAHELVTIAGNIDSAASVADQVRDSHSTLRSSVGAAGRPDVSNELDSFLGTWSYGLGCINGDARNLAHLLRLCGQAYEQTDQTIARAATPKTAKP